MRRLARITLFPLPAAVILAALATPADGQETRRFIEPRTPADSVAPPYSGAVMVGNTLYLSGTLGTNPDGTIPGSVEQEIRNMLDIFKSRIEAADMTMDDLVVVQVFCSDVELYDTFNRIYRTYFTSEFPARAFIGSGELLRGARFEIQGIAARR